MMLKTWSNNCESCIQEPRPWFSIKLSSYQYRKSHCGDKTVVRLSYLHNGISYTGKMTSSHWTRALFYSCRTYLCLDRYILILTCGLWTKCLTCNRQYFHMHFLARAILFWVSDVTKSFPMIQLATSKHWFRWMLQILTDRKSQDYVYVKGEYQSIM